MKKSSSILALLLIFSFIIPISAVESDFYPSLQITFSEEIFSATPGNQGYMILELKNVGSTTVEGIRIIATTADYSIIRSEGDWERSFGDLSSGSSLSALFHYKVSSTAQPGLYEMKFQIKTTNAGYHTQYALIKIEEPETIDIISLSPTYLDIGKQTTMTLTLSNNGQIKVTDILLSWEDEYSYILPVGTDNRIKISSVEAGNTTDVSFDVIVSPSLPAGVYPIYFMLDFYDQTGSKQTISSQIGIQIAGATNFEVVEESASSTTTLAIANTGANTASSVIVKIPDQINYATIGSNSVNLGNLGAGDYTLATFQISQQTSNLNGTQFPLDGHSSQRQFDDPNVNMSDRPGFMNRTSPGTLDINSALIVEISYTDLFGIRQTVQKEVTMSSSSAISMSSSSSPFSRSSGQVPGQSGDSSSGLDTGTMYILAGVLGIVIIIAIIKFDKIKTLPKTLKAWKGKKHEDQ